MIIFFKIAGCLSIFLSFALTGIYYSFKDEYRIRDLKEMKSALLILKSEIEFAYNTLPNAFIHISERTSPPISGFFKSTANRLEARRGDELSVIWQEESVCLNGAYFTQDDYAAFTQLSKTIGYLDKSLQINSISMALKYIDETTAVLLVSSEKNKKLCKSLGLLGGLMAVIVLL